LIVFDHARKKT